MIGLFINTLPLRVKVSPQEKLGSGSNISRPITLSYGYEHSHGQVHEWSEVPGFYPYESILVFENYPVDSTILQSSVTPIYVTAPLGHKPNMPLPFWQPAVQSWS